MNKSKTVKLFSGLCCSDCRHDFSEESINILREDKNLVVAEILCRECGKNFGIALIGAESFCDDDDDCFVIKDCPLPVSSDDVLDAHKFLSNLEEDWAKYIPENLKK